MSLDNNFLTKKSLLDIIEDNRIYLKDIDFEQINYVGHLDEGRLQGKILEQMVYQWLNKCDFLFYDKIPNQIGKYILTNSDNGVLVSDTKGETKHEFDFLGLYQETPYIIEVKSGKIAKYKGKIENAHFYAKKIYKKDSELILFSPLKRNLRKTIFLLEDYPKVEIVDLGYEREELDETVKKFKNKMKRKLFIYN